jgi:hypothetical protein
MTKKDYVKAAKIVQDMVSDAKDTSRVIGPNQRHYEMMAATEASYAFIKLFEGDNPRFNKEKFLVACGEID